MPNLHLVLKLKRARLMSGPLSKPTRHSDLSVVKSFLLGNRIVKEGFKAYNNFGSAVHSLFLVNKRGKWKLNSVEKRHLDGMIKSLNSHVVVKHIMDQCHVREKRRGARLYSVPIRFTPDAHGKSIGADLKTTACEDLEDFTQKAFEYGYFRQGDTYSLAVGGLKEFWIIGIGKKPPYKVMLTLLNGFENYIVFTFLLNAQYTI